MNKKVLLSTSIMLGVIVLIIICCVIANIVNRNSKYKQGLECFNDKNWACVIDNYEKLNYKDSKKKLKFAKYENYLQNANSFLKNKQAESALNNYKAALVFQPDNEEIKIKVQNLEIIVKEEKKREEIKKKQQEEQARINAIKAKISDSAFYPIPTKFGEGYDNTIKRYGVATINRINKLAPKVAEFVAQNPRCTRVAAVDVADDRSTRNSLAFFVDCGSIGDYQRYYVNEKELKPNTIPKSVKEQAEAISNSQYLMMCEAEIKARLNFPSTYKPSIVSSSVYKATMNTVATIPFKAKNAFNLELKHRGKCYYNGTTLTDINISEE